MAQILLQPLAESIQLESLPLSWQDHDISFFSKGMTLWDYQQQAVQNALKVLWKYYEDLADYEPSEKDDVNNSRKEALFQWYLSAGLTKDLSIPTGNLRRDIAQLLNDYYLIENEKIDYQFLINRMNFWMATASGKSLVLIKLIEVLRNLMRDNEIPSHDILILTHREDLIEQLKYHISLFNSDHRDIFIRLIELKEYANNKLSQPSLLRDQEINVFYYRSDNISDDQKEKIIDFRNYDNFGRWFILLDEAHKGDKEDSKRQHIYNILSRNGFLFNFSATFTDIRDEVTTVFNFNLSRFIQSGYGKHISILKQEIREFHEDDEYTDIEKKKIVLKSLIVLVYVNSYKNKINKIEQNLYHQPLLLTLVNSVNIEDADLKLFFRELAKIGRGEITKEIFEQCKEELIHEFQDNLTLIFEDAHPRIDLDAIRSIKREDMWESIFNSKSPGEIEVLVRPSNRQEMAFKIKTSEIPFGLIKIGDISDWLKDLGESYEINERFEDESYFSQLNTDHSPINILMGSRSFYEGWDSNRPNVINYINIGTSSEAKKFILQSVGRGVRIEPFAGQRQRLAYLQIQEPDKKEIIYKIRGFVDPLETLIIFATNRSALETVISELSSEDDVRGVKDTLSLFINDRVKETQPLLIPTYRYSDHVLFEERQPVKFELSPEDLTVLGKFVNWVGDEKVLTMCLDCEPKILERLKNSLEPDQKTRYYDASSVKSFRNPIQLANKAANYFNIHLQDLEGLKPVVNEINHYQNISVVLETIEKIQELKAVIDKVHNYPLLEINSKSAISDVIAKYQAGKISLEEFQKEIENNKPKQLDFFQDENRTLNIHYIAQHYYNPLITIDDEKELWIKHIIKVPSEVQFIEKLEQYIKKQDSLFNNYDWWMFSRLDDSTDRVYIPYIDPISNRVREFHPDFIFWLKKGEEYQIVFVDPKGISQVNYLNKMNGAKRLFEENGLKKKFNFDNLYINIYTFLYTTDVARVPDQLQDCWFDSFEMMFSKIN